MRDARTESTGPAAAVTLLGVVLLALLLTGLAGCGGSRPQPRPTPPRPSAPPAPTPSPTPSPAPTVDPNAPTQRPYKVNGRTYRPVLSSHGYEEEGIASWYGRDFHGRPTSCGETYNMYAMTAAHKLLPMQTQLRVINLDNGRQIQVRVNDRGPFVDGRIIDLSYAAAKALDMHNAGTAHVRIESLTSVPGVTAGEMRGEFYVQVGAFSVPQNARALAGKLQAAGYGGTRVEEALVSGGRYWRVQAGTWQRLTAAEEARDRLSQAFPGAFVVNGSR